MQIFQIKTKTKTFQKKVARGFCGFFLSFEFIFSSLFLLTTCVVGRVRRNERERLGCEVRHKYRQRQGKEVKVKVLELRTRQKKF